MKVPVTVSEKLPAGELVGHDSSISTTLAARSASIKPMFQNEAYVNQGQENLKHGKADQVEEEDFNKEIGGTAVGHTPMQQLSKNKNVPLAAETSFPGAPSFAGNGSSYKLHSEHHLWENLEITDTIDPSPPPKMRNEEDRSDLGSADLSGGNPDSTGLNYREFDDWLQIPPPVPEHTLSRNRNITTSVPGAHHVAGIGGSNAQGAYQDSDVDEQQTIVNDQPNLHLDLAVARAIDDTNDASLMRAEEVNLAELERKKAAERYQKKMFFWAGFLVVIIVLVVVFVVAFVNPSKDSFEVPTMSPSLHPSDVPSFAPSGELDLLFESLSNATRESVKMYPTPQWHAREWLAGHPNLSGMGERKKKQLFALATFFYSFEGPSWPQVIRDNWLLYEKSECFWFSSEFGDFSDDSSGWQHWQELAFYNMTPCNEQDEFQSLFLVQLDLASYHPRIPPEISLLTSLVIMDLQANDINSSLAEILPSQIYQMSNILVLALHNNSFSGSIPSEFGLMTSMTNLNLNKNGLSGLLPSQLGLMTNLVLGDFSENSLSGPIPTQLGLMTSMTLQNLYSNGLSGEIPSQVGLMTNLVGLSLLDNSLSGTLPSELGLLISLTKLYLYTNSLSGEIPSQCGLMTNMESLQLSRNSLTGTIPTELALMTSMTKLLLHKNGLSGEIPSHLWLMTSMAYLGLSSNALISTIQTDIGLMTKLTDLFLQNNRLSGEIPSQFGLLTGMLELDLSENALTGPIPSELQLLINMTNFYLNSNHILGEIPSQFGLMTNILGLSLNNNILNDPVPTELGLLVNMTRLSLYSNELSGEIPTQFGLLTNMFKLELSENQFKGLIPSEIGLMTNMATLWLKNNIFTGTIPRELGWLAMNGSLVEATFANNSFSGTVPDGLCSLGLWSESFEMGLSFDCNDQLCGCCWCPCSISNTSIDCRTQPFLPSDDENWPGAFPDPLNATNMVIINLFSDDFPEETTLEWSIHIDSSVWEVLESLVPQEIKTLYSYTIQVVSNATYRLQVLDIYGDGTCCGANGLGWFTITNSTPSAGYTNGTVLWEASGDFESSLEVLLWIDPYGRAQHVEDLPGGGSA